MIHAGLRYAFSPIPSCLDKTAFILVLHAIAKKLRRSVVIEEHFEFTIRAAHTVKISACAHCILRVPREFRHTVYKRHSKYGVE